MENSQIERKNQLEKALQASGLGIRMDSKLCYCFVNGQTGPEWDVDRVVKECSVMHWLYNFTDYQARCHFASENESRIHCFHSQRQFLSYMRKYIFPGIKESIIAGNGGLPATWPWINSTPTETETMTEAPTETETMTEAPTETETIAETPTETTLTT